MEKKLLINLNISYNYEFNYIIYNNNIILLLKGFIIFSILFIFIYFFKIINISFFNDYNKQNKLNNTIGNKNIGGSLPLPNPNNKKNNKKKDKEEVNKKSSEKKYRKRDIFLTIATTIFFGILIYIFFKGSGGDNPSDLGSSSSLLSNRSQTKIFLKTTNIETLSIISSATLAIISQHFSIIKEIEDTSLTQESINVLANMGSEYFFKMKSSDVNISNQATKEFKAFIDLLQNNLDIENVRKIQKQMIFINNTKLEIHRLSDLIESYMINNGINHRLPLPTIKDILSDDYITIDDKCFITKTISEDQYKSYLLALKIYCSQIDEQLDKVGFYEEVHNFARMKKMNRTN